MDNQDDINIDEILNSIKDIPPDPTGGRDDWSGMAKWRKESRENKRNSMHNMCEKNKIVDRVEFPNEGTCLVDGEFYYYCQSKKARKVGQNKYYQMRGFQHFIDTFLKNKKTPNKNNEEES